jgi:Ca2+-binding EF-hand superfamily protein
MAIAFLEVTEPRSAAPEAEPQRNKQKLIVKTAEEKSENEAADKFVEQFFARFDKNRDGIVERSETPLGFRRFGFTDLDGNDDGKLDRDEVQSAAEARQRKD